MDKLELPTPGMHGNLLVVLDQCTYLPPSIWDASEALMNDPNARVLKLSSPAE